MFNLYKELQDHATLYVLADYVDEKTELDEYSEEDLFNGIYEQEVIYYHEAMKYLKEHDTSLRDTFEKAAERGYKIEDLNSELLATICYQEDLRNDLARFLKTIKPPCHVCGVQISKEELDENGAYTYPDNLPYCPDHQPEEE